AEGQPMGLHADTLRIDGDEETCTVTFRGTFPVTDEAALAAVRMVLGVELPGQPIPWPEPTWLTARPALSDPPTGDVLSIEDFEASHGDVLRGTMAASPDEAPPPKAPNPLPFRGSVEGPSPLRQASMAPPPRRQAGGLDSTMALAP